MTAIYVYLTFDGNCEAAMNFYKECLGGELTLNRLGGSGMEDQCPGAPADSILHASLNKGDLILMASDQLMPGEFKRGHGYSLSLNCSSEDEINDFYEKLSAGGEIMQPLGKQFWGAIFGMFTDKFGTRWMVNYDFNTAE